MLSTVVGLSGLVLNGPAAISSPSTAVPRASLVMMPVARIPGEGDPFPDGGMRRAEDIATKQPRSIADGSANLQYIETEDEPWRRGHAVHQRAVRQGGITEPFRSSFFTPALITSEKPCYSQKTPPLFAVYPPPDRDVCLDTSWPGVPRCAHPR